MERPQELELWRYLKSQRELAAWLIEGDSLEEVAPHFLEIVAGLLRWEAGALWEVIDDSEPLRLVRGWSTPDLDAEPLWQRSRELRFLPGTGLPGDAWASGEIALAPNYREYPTPAPRYDISAQLGLEAALAIPVPIGPSAGVLAVAEFHTRAFNPQSQELMALLAGFADQLGAFIARRRAEARSAEAERFRQHLAEVVRGTQDAVLSKDLEGIVTTWNPAAERLYGYSAEEALGRHISFLVPPDHKDEEKVILDRVKRGERLETYETERIRADGARIAVSLTVSPIRSPMRGLIGASVVARDITAEMRRRRAQEFLVAASRLLDTSLDPVETARTIVSTAVPELAELCVIDFRRPDGWLGDSVVAGANPEMAARLERIRREQPLDPAGEHPVAQVLRLERPMIWRDLKSPEVVDKVSQGPDHLRLMEEAGYNSAAVVPLVARGRSLGAISFLHAFSNLRYDPDDLTFLAELGDRAALALDNARLYRERDRVAKSLQRGLRPPRPAEVPGLDISVVFEAAGEGIEIGGDLYDVLLTDDGCWILVGDVAGKGSAAAGVSVAVRHSVRGLAQEDAEPDEVLRRVNELLLSGESLNDFATAMLARLRREGSGWRVVLASAGHPPAVRATPEGPRLLGGGSVLGAWPEANVMRHETVIDADSTLVLCTDGWLEAGPVTHHQGPDNFAAMIQSLAGLELDEMTERLRADAVNRSSGPLRDDLVVLAVRPRPAPAEDKARRELVVGAD
ncbi:MAG TPA: SpoIIE family protein phosphatase [Solirubrobacterales bacterium]|jgi:PAS domain S-box-containing protein|nr:SpoIIE family protein phosphatase [Solirubrobacterales bacterium]